MKAVILAGGLGTRLHPITLEIPKPLLPVHRKPIIQYLVELFRSSGISEIFVLANVRDNDLFARWKQEYRNKDVLLVKEHDRLGTWGGIQKYLRNKLRSTFIVSNGDELKEIDVRALLKFHKTKKAFVTIAVLASKNPKDYSVLVSGRDGRVSEFIYKPQNPPSDFIMTGIYAVEPDVFNLHFESDVISFEEDVVPYVIKSGKIYEFKYQGRWYDCGTFERYEKAIQEW